MQLATAMASPHTDPGVPAHGLGPAGLRVSVPDRLGTVVDGPLFLSKIPFSDIRSNQGDTRIKTQGNFQWRGRKIAGA